MAPFKPGDRVKRVSGLNFSNSDVMVGGTYIVKKCGDGELHLEERRGDWAVSNFELVEKAMSVKITYKEDTRPIETVEVVSEGGSGNAITARKRRGGNNFIEFAGPKTPWDIGLSTDTVIEFAEALIKLAKQVKSEG